MNEVEQGRTFEFTWNISGPGNSAFTTTMNVLQYPGDTPAISRTIDYACPETRTGDSVSCGYIGTLTAAETNGLDVGEWWIHMTAVDSDENLAEPIKLYVKRKWA